MKENRKILIRILLLGLPIIGFSLLWLLINLRNFDQPFTIKTSGDVAENAAFLPPANAPNPASPVEYQSGLKALPACTSGDILRYSSEQGVWQCSQEQDAIWVEQSEGYANLTQAENIRSDWNNSLYPWSDREVKALNSGEQGSVLYKSASGWTALAPGQVGQILTTNGAGNNPQWTNFNEATSASISIVAGSGLSGGGIVQIGDGGTITVANAGVTSLNGLTAGVNLAGTANQVDVSTGSGLVTISLPQDIATSSTPTFAGLTIGTLNGILIANNGAVSASADTTDLPEGSNLYFTEARSRDAITTISPILYDPVTGVISFDNSVLNTGTLNGNQIVFGTLGVYGQADEEQLVVRGYSTQNSNLQEWQNNLGNAIASIDGLGNFSSNSVEVTGTNGNGYLSLPAQSSTPSAPGSGLSLFATNSSQLAWVGDDGFVRTVDDSGLTLSRSYILPDASGTIALINSSDAGYVLKTGDTMSGALNVYGSSDIPQLVLRSNAAQNTNLQEWQNNSGGLLAAINSLGYMGLGGTAPDANNILRITSTFTDPAFTPSGVRVDPTLLLNANNTTGINGIRSGVTVNQNGFDVSGSVRAFNAIATASGSAGTVSSLQGVASQVSNIGDGTVSAGYGVRVLSGNNSGFGSIGSLYGLYVENQNAGNANYAIYTNSGLNRFGDSVNINGSRDEVQLIVQGNSTQTANLLEAQNSAGTSMFTITGDGNVGIGDSTPNQLLTVGTNDAFTVDSMGFVKGWVGTSAAPGYAFTNDGNTGIWGGLDILGFSTAGLERGRFTSAGDFGVGTDSPIGRFHSYIGNSAVTTNNYTGYFENLSTNITTDAINKYGAYITSTGTFTGLGGTATNNYGLYVNTPTGADNNYAAIFAGGNVGIGTTTPTSTLSIAGTLSALMATNAEFRAWRNTSNTEVIVQAPSANAAYIQFQNTADTYGVGVDSGSGSLRFNSGWYGSNTTRMTLTSTGNLGIGMTPTNMLDVAGTAAASSFISSPVTWSGKSFTLASATASGFLFNNTSSITNTSGPIYVHRISATFAPTSGTGTFILSSLQPTVNQTGGASGIARGIYVNPTLTAAADWRSIETTNNTGYAFYGAGVANSYFGGNVGIGTGSPTGQLHSYGSGDKTATHYTGLFENLATNPLTNGISKYGVYITSTGAFAGSGGTATNNYGLYVDTPSGADNNYAAIFAGGNVGIGTATPTYPLEVIGNTRITGSMLVGGSGGNTYIALNHGAQFNMQVQSGNFYIHTGNLVPTASFFTILSSNGNVGLSTLTPVGRLHSYISNSAVTATSYNGYFENLSTNTTTDAINKYGVYITSTGSFAGSSGTATNNYGLYVDTPSGADNNYAAVFAGGNVGIGTASPVYKLHIAEVANNASQGIYLSDVGGRASGLTPSNGGTGIPWVGSMSNDSFSLGANNAEAMRILTSGNVGIGNISPGAKLQIDAAASSKGLIVKANATTPGNIFEAQNSSGTVLANVTSDGRGGFGAAAPTGVGLYTNGTLRFDGQLFVGNATDIQVRDTAGGGNTRGISGLNFVRAGGTGDSYISGTGNFGVGLSTGIGAKVQIDAATSGKGLIVKANATTPGNIFEAQNSSGTALVRIDGSGWVGINNPATLQSELHVNGSAYIGNVTGVTANYGAAVVSRRLTNPTSYQSGIYARSEFAQTSASYNGQNFGVASETWLMGTNTQDWTLNYGLVGGYYKAEVRSGATGTITGMVGGLYEREQGGATVTNSYGIVVRNPLGASSPTNNYGIFIENQTKGSSLNYSIYSVGGQAYFGGNVGIGTTNSGAKLQIDAAASGKGLIIKANATTPGALYEYQNSSGGVLASAGMASGGTIKVAFGQAADFSSDYGTSVIFNSGGYAQEAFQVLGSNAARLGWSMKSTYDTGNPVTAGYGISYSIYPATGAVMTVSNDYDYRPFQMKAGKYGMGVNMNIADIDGFVHIKSSNAGLVTSVIQMASGQTSDSFQVRDNAGTTLFSINNTGAISSAAGITSSGTITFSGLASCGSGIQTNGSGVLSCLPSDQSIKTNVQILAKSLDKVMQLRGVSYNWTDTAMYGAQSEFGLIAQEVEQIAPELVFTMGNGLKGVKYNQLTGLLVEAIKDQQAEIDQIKAQLGLDPQTDILTQDSLFALLGSQTIPNLNVANLEVDNTIQAQTITVLATANFKGDVQVAGQLTLGNDGAGRTIIETGKTKVSITFSKPYAQIPVVTVSPIGLTTVNYGVSNITTSGFEIEIASPQAADLEFNWIAVGTK